MEVPAAAAGAAAAAGGAEGHRHTSLDNNGECGSGKAKVMAISA